MFKLALITTVLSLSAPVLAQIEAGPVVGDTVTIDLKIQAAQVVEKK